MHRWARAASVRANMVPAMVPRRARVMPESDGGRVSASRTANDEGTRKPNPKYQSPYLLVIAMQNCLAYKAYRCVQRTLCTHAIAYIHVHTPEGCTVCTQVRRLRRMHICSSYAYMVSCASQRRSSRTITAPASIAPRNARLNACRLASCLARSVAPSA